MQNLNGAKVILASPLQTTVDDVKVTGRDQGVPWERVLIFIYTTLLSYLMDTLIKCENKMKFSQ